MGQIDIDPVAPWSILRKELKAGNWKNDREKRDATAKSVGPRRELSESRRASVVQSSLCLRLADSTGEENHLDE